ncbi:hypothetical protein IMY05_013G0034900 [Salix suchowensis]|nr:hypothetical protein IMY05_013G0034900 [Salix suchowensis]
MGDQQGSWPRSVTAIALWLGAGLRSPQEGDPTSKFVAEGAAQAAAPEKCSPTLSPYCSFDTEKSKFRTR